MRYKLTASFQEEQRKGFVTTHEISKEFETAKEMSDEADLFLRSYDSKFCHHLKFQVIELNDA